MVKSSSWIKLFLVLVMVMVSVVTMAPMYSPQMEIEDMSDSSKRNARSANPSSIAAGTVDKIKILIHGRFLQILRNGTVDGTQDENSDDIILHRSSVKPGQVKIEGVATCSFLCMNSCGCLYSTADEINDECIFNEMLESNHFVSYTSVKYSNENHTFYVALSKAGKPHRVRRPTGAGVGDKVDYVSAFPIEVESQRMEQLEQRKRDLYTNHQHHHLRHRQLCPPPHHTKVADSLRCQCKRPKKKSKSCPGAVDRSDESAAHSPALTKEAAAQRHRTHDNSKKKTHSQTSDCKGKKSHKKKNSPSKHSSEVHTKVAHQPASAEEAEEKEATTPATSEDSANE